MNVFKNQNYVINETYGYNLYSIILYYNIVFIYLDFGTHILIERPEHNILLCFLYSNGF
jgi:hypothetical protein